MQWAKTGAGQASLIASRFQGLRLGSSDTGVVTVTTRPRPSGRSRIAGPSSLKRATT